MIEGAAIGSSGPFPQGAAQSILRDGRLGYMVDDTSYLYDTTTGALISTQTNWDAVTDTVFGTQVYNSENNVIVYNGSDGGDPNIIFLDRGSGEGETLGDIVSAICERTGLTAADIDATDLDETVRGYLIGKQMTARAALEPLAQAFFFYGVETDFQVKFIHHGGSSVATIPENDLAVINEDTHRVIEETRRQELELPEDFDVIYIDVANAYQTGDQHDKRIRQPEPTMRSENPMRFELPIVFNADEARSIVERALYQAWVERVSVSFRTSWKYLYLNPGDVVTIVRNDGTTYVQRIAKNDFNGDMSVSMESIATDQVTYDASGAAGGGGTNFPQDVGVNNFTRLFIPNLPLLRDVDDNLRQQGVVYYAMAGYGQPGWKGAVLYRNTVAPADPNYEGIAQSVTEVIWGFVSGTMSAPPISAESFDHETELTVFLTDKTATLSSVTYSELLQGANAACVGKESIGWEVFQFQDAEQNDDGSWTLTNLFRGRRGTEYLAGTHGTGEQFILLETDTVDLFNIALDRLDLPDYYRAVGFGQIPEDTVPVTKTELFLDLAPWSPCQLDAVVDGDDIDLSWVRRTRIHGAWLDGEETVPLNEDTEEYKVEILTPFSGAVIRTYEDIFTNSMIYPEADILEDISLLTDDTDSIVVPLTITNPGADVDVSGWTNDTGTLGRRTVLPTPHSGAGAFSGGTSAVVIAHQDVDVSAYATEIDSGLTKVRLTWWQAGDVSGTDTGEMAIDFYDGSPGSIIGSRHAAGLLEYDSNTWTQRTLSLEVPVGTRTIRLVQHMVRGTGTNNDAYIDDIEANLLTFEGVLHQLRYRVYQISAQVGDGIPGEATVAIEYTV
jgi:hypothetical protein